MFLSVGYAACHWCHVMAHESFEDAATAELMNARFVNIKLDREERPDLDMVYQTAHGLMSQRGGGWPLTVFLSPHTLRPFFCGTYFPKEPRHGLPAFREVLAAVAEQYHKSQGVAVNIGKQVQNALGQIYSLSRGAAKLPDDLSERACRALLNNLDEVSGGFGGAPKFPQTDLLQCLLRRHARDQSPAEGRAVRLTLRSFCRRGLYDHLGGGFFRYCVDDAWRIPHFEKMLYDNGQILGLLADAHELFGDDEPGLAEAAAATAAWLERDMQAEDGGYYAALDADNTDGEGAFYAWTTEELGAA